MDITIDDKIKLTNIQNLELKKQLITNLSFENPQYVNAVKYGKYTSNIERYLTLYTDIPNGIIIPRGYLQIIEPIIESTNVQIQDNRILSFIPKIKSTIKLYDYQNRAKHGLLKRPNGILIAPAGSGKTIIGLDIIATVAQKALWLTHTKRLAAQFIDRALSVFPNLRKDDIGIIGGGKFTIGEELTVGMVPTLVRREMDLPTIGREFGVVILDEAHHLPASTFLKVLSSFHSYYIYGLTATPNRRDGLENLMFSSIGPPQHTILRSEVKDANKIVTPLIYVRRISSSDYNENDYNFIMQELIQNNKNRMRIIVSDIVREAKSGNCGIVISIRKLYAETIFENVQKHLKSKVGIATGDYSDAHNQAQISKLENGEIDVLITIFNLLGEGFDVPRLNRGFLISPFREKSRVEQSIGRIQRPHDGKNAIFYDYLDENIGLLKNQFETRCEVYKKIGAKIKYIKN